MTELASPLVPIRFERLGVTAAYIAQGLSYATVVTALPQFKERYSIDDDTVSLITLTVVLGAAAGSVMADRVAVRLGSRASLVLGLALQAAALVSIAAPVPFPVFWSLFAVYGLGLGCVDASAAMQGVLVQRRMGKAVMGSFFAANTGAAIAGALLMSAGAATPLGASLGLVAAGAVAAVTAALGVRLLDPTRERAADTGSARPPLPMRGLWALGLVVLAALTADSTVATWSSIHLSDGLGASAAVAPLGYAVYAGTTLLTRLVSDLAVRRFGRAPLAIATVSIAGAGLLIAGAVPAVPAALLGFALAGMGVGALIPLAFSAAGDLDHRRGDEIIARVNLFNYPGALIGAVLPGMLASDGDFRVSFLLAAVLLLPALGAVRRFRAGDVARVPAVPRRPDATG
ncbi:MFS transporter [Demequina mangrovi]|uniref:Fucose permease n=1 Tax=Demequina mangrovi TaxID=1043493 RepID=A0A1H6TW97_9MICO|nr:MFS transporter [Demequina mangrovi]SEI84281.1 Fucose permease [Demequina mangrovi]